MLHTAGPTVEPSPLSLHEGWNLIAYQGQAAPVDEALSSIDSLYTEVRGFEGKGVSYLPDLPEQFSTLRTMKPGMGYLIYMDVAATLSYE